jgi:hypothetical protein
MPELNPTTHGSLLEFFPGDFKFLKKKKKKKKFLIGFSFKFNEIKIFTLVYELVNMGKNVHLFL